MLPTFAQQWHYPLSAGDITLCDALESLQAMTVGSDNIPFIVQFVENPKYPLAAIEIFSGGTDLKTHDYIHLVLGRGILPKDEAFVLGFTMGATNRVSNLEESLYGLFAKYLYPGVYRFSKDDFQIYKNAVRLGYISNCRPLHKINFDTLAHLTLNDARKTLGIETNLLRAYYEIEKQRYPESIESQRLLN